MIRFIDISSWPINNYTLRITIFDMLNLGPFREKLIFCKNSNLKFLLHVCDTYDCDYLPHTTCCFYLTDFQLNILVHVSFPNLRFFTGNHSVTERSVSQENA